MSNNALKAMGVNPYVFLDLDEGAAEVVKASAGLVYGIHIENRSTSPRYLKLYDALTATVGTAAPAAVIPIPANASDFIFVGVAFGGKGLYFNVGICIGASTGFANNDTGAPDTNDLVGTLYYL